MQNNFFFVGVPTSREGGGGGGGSSRLGQKTKFVKGTFCAAPLRRHAQSTAQMPNPIKSFSPKARFKVEECRAKVWRRVTKTQRPWRERKMRNLAGSCFALSNLASFPNFITLSTRTKQSLGAQIHTRPDYKICRKDFFWCNRPVAIRWRRVPELRMCESKMTRRNVPDPNWETQVWGKLCGKLWKWKQCFHFFRRVHFLKKDWAHG